MPVPCKVRIFVASYAVRPLSDFSSLSIGGNPLIAVVFHFILIAKIFLLT